MVRVDMWFSLPAGDVRATLSAVGKRVSETPQTPGEVAAFADAAADMLCDYLDTVGATRDLAAGTGP